MAKRISTAPKITIGAANLINIAFGTGRGSSRPDGLGSQSCRARRQCLALRGMRPQGGGVALKARRRRGSYDHRRQSHREIASHHLENQ